MLKCIFIQITTIRYYLRLDGNKEACKIMYLQALIISNIANNRDSTDHDVYERFLRGVSQMFSD